MPFPGAARSWGGRQNPEGNSWLVSGLTGILHWPVPPPSLVQVIHGLVDRIMEVLGVALQGTEQGSGKPTFSITPSQVILPTLGP